MSTLLAVCGWAAAGGLVFELRRRSALLRDAAHELRGPLGTMSLGLELLRRQPVARRRAEALFAELARAEAAVEDVSAAARGRRAPARVETVELRELVASSSEAWRPAAKRVDFEWPAEDARVEADRRRLAQAFGNLLANAVEHGGGDVVVRGRPRGDAVTVEVIDAGGASRSPGSRKRGRGRGLAIAGRAVREAGGSLETGDRSVRNAGSQESGDRAGGGRVARVELPLTSAR